MNEEELSPVELIYTLDKVGSKHGIGGYRYIGK
ncbi:hypothetical protein [Romboutsia sp. 1001713B170207_170306_H8]